MSHSLPSSPNPPGSISGDFLDQIGQLICGYVTKRGWFILKDFSETGSKKSFEKKRVGFKDGGERGHDRRQDQEPWRGLQKKGWRRESAPVGAYPDGGHWGVPGDPTPPPALTASLPRGPWSCFLNHIERTIRLPDTYGAVCARRGRPYTAAQNAVLTSAWRPVDVFECGERGTRGLTRIF